MAVVQAEGNLVQVGIAVVLRYGRPCMPERVETIIVLLCHSHVLAYFTDADVHVGVETVIVTIAAVENKQVLVILVFGKVFVERVLDERLNPHFHICLVLAAVPCLCPFVANDTIVVVFLLQLVQVNSIDTANAERE